jgi:hypothetical protein
VDSNNVGCPRVDSTIVLFGLNPVVKTPVLITPETLCKGDSAIHRVAVLNANAGASYFDLFKSASGPAIARLNANGDSVLVYSVAAPASPIQNGDVLYTIATDTVTGCSKQSDTLLATVVDAPNAGFTYERTGLNITFTDTTFASVSRSWFFNGAAPDSLNTPVTYVQTFPQGGTYEVVLKSANSQGCFDYTTQSVVVFNTGWDEVSEIPLSVYPNPANDRLFVNCESAVSGLIRVTDVHGKKVTMDLEMKDGKGMIDIQSLAPGYYQISIFTNEFVKVVKFIKE